MQENKEDGLSHFVRLDENLSDLLNIFEEMEEDISKIVPSGVPQTAAKDRMTELMDGAFYPYLNEFIQCNQVFEQGE